jgi:hypothetical protein
MGVLRLGFLGAAAYGIYKYRDRVFGRNRRRTHDGLSAVFSTREQADLAIEHLVQEHGIDRGVIYVEPVGGENSAGDAVSGGDHASGEAGSRDRVDGALLGSIEVTVPISANPAKLTRILRDAGAQRVEAF